MIRQLVSIFVFLLPFTCLIAQQSFYDFSVSDIDGHPVHLSDYRGKKVLVVNVASQCGNTPQYANLESLYEKYGPDNFVILGFPANDFGAQEPGTNEEIKTFCSTKYHVTFPMMSKITVKGDHIHPLYRWLTMQSENGVMDAPVTWNFQKFMIDESGHLVGMIKPKEMPDNEAVIKWIEEK